MTKIQTRAVPDGIIGISSVPWEYLPIAPQQTLKALAEKVPVLFVERQHSVAGVLLEPSVALRALADTFGGPREIANDLYVVTAGLAAPWTTRSLKANRASMWLLKCFVDRARRALGMRAPVVIAYVPQAHLLRHQFDEVCFVYDVIDEYSAFPQMNVDLCKQMEANMCRTADLVIAISENLVEERLSYCDEVFHLPIGAESVRFLSVERGTDVPGSLASLPMPRVGYYGSIDGRLDVSMCAQAARDLPQVSFVYYGPIRDEQLIVPLRHFENVHFPGPIPYDDLPRYSVNFDVCVLPYAKTRFNRYIFPNKIFEYLATGNPVVTSAVPALSYLERDGMIAIAHDGNQFVSLLEHALSDGRFASAQRQRCALENTWTARAEKLWAYVTQWLNEGN